MNELRIFKNEEFGEIRMMEIKGTLYFVGKDVAEILGYTNTPKAIRDHIDDEDKLTERIFLSGQNREVIFINESGLYSLILSSKLPTAKRFKHWVTSEVLPSIRKNGGYMSGQETLSDDELMAKALLVAQNKIAERDKLIEQMKPKEIFADAVSSSKTSILVGDMAKLLKQNGIDIGQKRFFEWPRSNGYLIKRKGSDWNMPTQKAMEMGLFEIKESTHLDGNGCNVTKKTPKVTGNVFSCSMPTVDAWFECWIKEVKSDTVRQRTLNGYISRYQCHIKDHIGKMLLSDVKPLYCQNILNSMAEKYNHSTIRGVKVMLREIFEYASENDFIGKNPVSKKIRFAGKISKEKRVLTIEEQRMFLEEIKRKNHYNQYAFVLQTGLRAGELIALRWSDIDYENRILHVRRNMYYVSKGSEWRTDEPKTKTGLRDIPLTQEAIDILNEQRKKRKELKAISFEFADLVFLDKNGFPICNNTYNAVLSRYCSKKGIDRFSMHTLRHTFATRCIEGGMKPKTLQTIMGHASITITMDLYVHTTEEEKSKEMYSVEDRLCFK